MSLSAFPRFFEAAAQAGGGEAEAAEAAAAAAAAAADSDDGGGTDSSWRSRDKKGKTLTLGLIMCLNIGVTPPDVIKTNPCAKLEAWIDPSSMVAAKAMEAISARLTSQYLRWQPKAKFRQAPDPTLDEVKRLCMALRRRAKDDSVLLHFNGHGVPKPTANGELWVFNKNFTQYVPASIYDIQTWVGSPTIFVYDCSGAGLVVDSFKQFALKRERDYQRKANRPGSSLIQVAHPLKECMQLAACREHETLPTDPTYPADIFTACLTTPIEMALRWVLTTRQKHMLPGVTLDMIDNIPGTLSERTTMRGQLNWIFTAITDTIAWNILPSELFQRIFRNDLLAAALFRNFLLAERIMRGVNCMPVSDPPLPPAFDHPLWEAWDMAVDFCLAQLPGIFAEQEEFRPCPFFGDQLTAFQVWLDMGGSSNEEPPEQLPIVLQVLLSQSHRLRALELLDRFLGMGPWAVRKSLSVGIFPYVLKLLGSQAWDLQPVLISIWARIIAVDASCKLDLLKPAAGVAKKTGSVRSSDRGAKGCFAYFVRAMEEAEYGEELHALAAFVLTVFLDHNSEGQPMCLAAGLLTVCVSHISAIVRSAKLRQWVCLALSKLWENYPDAQEKALQMDVTIYLLALLRDPMPQVRAAALQALGSLVGPRKQLPREVEMEINVHRIGLSMLALQEDGSHAVRTELASSLSPLVVMYKSFFVAAAARTKENERLTRGRRDGQHDAFTRLWRGLQTLSVDPYPTVAEIAMTLLQHLGMGRGTSTTTGTTITLSSSQTSPAWSETLAIAHPRRTVTAPSGQPSTPTLAGSLEPGSLPSSAAASSVPGLDWCKDYVRLPASATVGIAPPNSGETEALSQLLAFLQQATNCLELKEQGVKPSEEVSLAQINSAISNALELVPALQGKLQAVGWQGTRFGDRLSSATLMQTIQVVRTLMDDMREASHVVRLRLCQTHLFPCCVGSFNHWTQAGDRNPHKEAETLEWLHERQTMELEQARALAAGRPQAIKLSEAVFHKLCGEVYHLLRFHPYEPRLYGCSADSGQITVFDTVAVGACSTFHSGASKGQRLTSCQVVNEERDGMLMLGSSDGVVRLWRDLDSPLPTMATAWRAVQKMKDSRDGPGSGLVLAWSQSRGQLVATGDVPHMQVWDCGSETRTRKMVTNVNSCVTSLSFDGSGYVMVAGYGNGFVRLYDLRCADDRVMTQHYDHHKSWVVNAHIQKGGKSQILSGSKRGDILWWDPRYPAEPIRSVQAHKLKADDSMTAFEMHDYAPLLASSSPKQYLKIFNLEGEQVASHKHYTNFLGEAIGATAALAFHPFKPLLASSSYEKMVSIYAPSA